MWTRATAWISSHPPIEILKVAEINLKSVSRLSKAIYRREALCRGISRNRFTPIDPRLSKNPASSICSFLENVKIEFYMFQIKSSRLRNRIKTSRLSKRGKRVEEKKKEKKKRKGILNRVTCGQRFEFHSHELHRRSETTSSPRKGNLITN